MVKYFIPRKQIRFTVFTQDKINTDADSQLYGTPQTINLNPNQQPYTRNRKFVFKLNSSEQLNGNKCKISVESVKCRDMENVLQGSSHDTNTQLQAVNNNPEGLQRALNRMIDLGNTDEKELYTIRANFVSQSKHLDTRPQEYKTGGIVYNGSLNFTNTNPLITCCYDCDANILNNEIILYIDSNYYDMVANPTVNEKGIKPALQVAVTFIVWDGDEVEAIDGNTPNFNSLHISNRDRV